MPHSCGVENCPNNVKSQPNLNFYIFLESTMALTASSSSSTTALKILYSSLVDQLFAKEVDFGSIGRKSNQACIKYSPRCI